MTEPRYIYFLAHTGRDTERAKELRNLLHPDVQVMLSTSRLLQSSREVEKTGPIREP